MESAYNCEGYFDHYHLTGTELASLSDIVKKRKSGSTTSSGMDRYEFVLTPNFGFLASPEPLLKDCELKLSFDRSSWQTVLTEYASVTTACTKLEIKDCYAITEYVSSPLYRDYFSTIESAPMIYNYDECDVLIKSIPLNETEVRFDNIRGGNTPAYIFAGIISQGNLNGNKDSSSTRFTCNHVEEFNILLNGNSVSGFPISVNNSCPVFPMYKFLEVTDRIHNVNCGRTLNMNEFNNNWIWAYKSEAEASIQGWTSISFKLKQAFTEPTNLVVWIINDVTLTIDKFHAVEKISNL